MDSWLIDIDAEGKRAKDWTDGATGTISRIEGDGAHVVWDDGTTSWIDQDFLEMI